MIPSKKLHISLLLFITIWTFIILRSPGYTSNDMLATFIIVITAVRIFVILRAPEPHKQNDGTYQNLTDNRVPGVDDKGF